MAQDYIPILRVFMETVPLALAFVYGLVRVYIS